MKKSLSLMAGAVLSLAGSPVHAQGEAPQAQSSSTEKARAQTAALEEVIVTARRRAENIQETPIAVTAISGEALREQGIVNTSELTKSVPWSGQPICDNPVKLLFLVPPLLTHSPWG